jgi:methylated-DNA-[protein]-cysteine S-methyltransferase
MLYKKNYQSPLGEMTLLSDETYLLGLWFKEQKYFAANYDLNRAKEDKSLPLINAIEWLESYFKGETPDSKKIKLKPEVTEFRKKVLKILIDVPYGSLITYKEISNLLQINEEKKRNMSQAVGGAVGHNPLSIIIPCHRVVGTDGSLTGYAGGLEKKKTLLALEQVHFKK